jgi:lipopolysaccharide export system ATP-binding protein
MPAAALEAFHLTWSVGHRRVVDGVSLRVDPGEIVGLLGPNGAGKTLTLSMIIGMITPESGRVLVNGQDVTRQPFYRRARAGVGYLPQEHSVFRGLSAIENLITVFESHGLGTMESRFQAGAMLADFGLTTLADARADHLSGGEKRRLEVARCLAAKPRVVLFDEPFTGIDPLAIESVHAALIKLRERGVGVLITDHNVQETLSLCDRAYVLCDGRVLAEGPPAKLAANPAVRDRFLGEAFQLSEQTVWKPGESITQSDDATWRGVKS